MSEIEVKETMNIALEDATLESDLVVPREPKGLVVFSHGAGAGRLSSRNRRVVERLKESRYASLLFDLLTKEEDKDEAMRFNIELLAHRLARVCRWAKKQEQIGDLNLALFGTDVGAASALKAAARLGDDVKAVISRGGRPDLAMSELDQVKCPVLLMVGQRDKAAIRMNKNAAKLIEDRELEIVEGAALLFEEPEKLDEVAESLIEWLDNRMK